MSGLIDELKMIGWMLVHPMTVSKLIKLAILGFIFAANFSAWGSIVGGFLGSYIPLVGGVIGWLSAIVSFVFCQYFEAKPEIFSLGCEEPEVTLKRLVKAAKSRFEAKMLDQDIEDEFDLVTPTEMARDRFHQAVAFGVDVLISTPSWWPFGGSLVAILIAPLGILDLNLWRLFMLLTTVFLTPRILISALRDGRIQSAKA